MPTKAFEAFCTIWRNSVMENICNSKARFPFLSVPVEAECLITLMSAFSMGKILEWKKNGKRIPRLVVLSSIQFRFSVMSNYLRPHELQQARPPYPSPTSGVYPNPCPLSRWCHPVISSSVVPFSSCSQLSQHQGLFQWVSSLHQVKYWNFSFNISPSNEHPRLISFRVDWLDLLAVQGTIKSLLQHNSSKASILQHSAFFIVQLSHPYTTIGKTIALARGTFICKVMSLIFNMLFRLIITFLPRSKHLLIWWLQSPSAVIVDTKI